MELQDSPAEIQSLWKERLSAKPLVLSYDSNMCCMKSYGLHPSFLKAFCSQPSLRQSHDQKENGRRFGKLPHQWPKKTRGTTSRLQCQWRGRRPGTTICFRAEFPRWFYRKGWVAWSQFRGQIREILWHCRSKHEALANSIQKFLKHLKTPYSIQAHAWNWHQHVHMTSHDSIWQGSLLVKVGLKVSR
jgi:hypothetical protein